mgnify:CR=1 FL=1
MENLNQTIVIDGDNYSTEQEKWNDIVNILKALLKNKQVAVIRDEDCGIISIEHEHDETFKAYGGAVNCWLTSEEFEEVMFQRDAASSDNEG